MTSIYAGNLLWRIRAFGLQSVVPLYGCLGAKRCEVTWIASFELKVHDSLMVIAPSIMLLTEQQYSPDLMGKHC